MMETLLLYLTFIIFPLFSIVRWLILGSTQ